MRVFVDTNLWADRLDQQELQQSRWLQKLQPPLPDHRMTMLEGQSGFEVVGTNTSLVLDAHQLAIAKRFIADAASAAGYPPP